MELSSEAPCTMTPSLSSRSLRGMSEPLLVVVGLMILLGAANGDSFVVIVAGIAALAVCELVLAALGAM